MLNGLYICIYVFCTLNCRKCLYDCSTCESARRDFVDGRNNVVGQSTDILYMERALPAFTLNITLMRDRVSCRPTTENFESALLVLDLCFKATK